MIKKSIAVVLLLLFIPTVSGCWNLRDPELLAIVLATAFDYDEEKEMYLIIVQVANPQAMQAEQESGSGGSGQKPFWVLSAHGHTPFDAMSNLGTGSSRELFWAHNRIVLFSENVSRRGIAEIMDLFERERQLRVIARPAVVQGDIRALMEAEFPLEETGARGLDRQMATIQSNKSDFHAKFLNEAYSAFEAPGQEVFLGRVKVQAGEEEKTDQGGGNGGSNPDGNSHPRPPALLEGGALFKGDRMVGWATPRQTEGWLLAMGRGQRFNFVLECPDCPDHYFSAEIFNARSTREVFYTNEKPGAVIKVEATSRIQNYSCAASLKTESEFIRSLERRTAQVIRNRIKDMIERSQELETDVLGFGNLFYRKRPKDWEKLKNRWDEIFPNLAVEVQVEINIMRTGLIEDPMEIQ